MSERDLQRVEVLGEVLKGARDVASAASVLALSERQVWRLLARYKSGGGGALTHRGRGRASNRRFGAGLREQVLELVRNHYRDFGPTLAAEMLADRHGVTVSGSG